MPTDGPGADGWSRSRCLVLEPVTGTLSWSRRLDLVLESRAGSEAGAWELVLEPWAVPRSWSYWSWCLGLVLYPRAEICS